MTRQILITTAIIVAALGWRWFIHRPSTPASPDTQVISQLRQAGSDLAKPHPLEVFLCFPDEASARQAAESVSAKGLSTEIRPPDSQRAEWLLFATRSMVPELSALTELRSFFEVLATAQKGHYDGWGTPVVR